MRKHTSKMHKATLFIEIICHKLGGKGLIGTQMYGQTHQILSTLLEKAILLYFRCAFAKQAVFL